MGKTIWTLKTKGKASTLTQKVNYIWSNLIKWKTKEIEIRANQDLKIKGSPNDLKDSC